MTAIAWGLIGLNTGMRLSEIQTTPTMKATKPIQATKSLNPQQARVATLKRNADNAKRVYKAEKDRQTVARAQTQIFAATHPKK